jgi:hypothetical protein
MVRKENPQREHGNEIRYKHLTFFLEAQAPLQAKHKRDHPTGEASEKSREGETNRRRGNKKPNSFSASINGTKSTIE